MDFLIDLVPALPFLLAALKLIDILTATKLAMGLAFFQLILSRWHYGRIKKIHLITFFAILIFGGVALYFNDPIYMKVKVTVLNWGFAIVFLTAPLVLKKNLLKQMLGDKLSMPEFAWGRLNLMWVAYFSLIGAVNLHITLNYSDDVWNTFRFFGMYGALITFMVLQGFYVYRHMTVAPEPAAEPKDPA